MAIFGWSVLFLVFVDELLAISAAATWGEYEGGTPLAIVAALAVVTVWYLFASPKARYGDRWVRPIVKVLVFTLASVAVLPAIVRQDQLVDANAKLHMTDAVLSLTGPGIAGFLIQVFTAPWPAGALVLLHSDGLASHWTLDRYPGLSARYPTLVAGVLYRDHRRGRDDTTVVVAREAA